jgi:hypothetical protein
MSPDGILPEAGMWCEREGSYLAPRLEPFDLCEHGGELSLAHLLVLLLGDTGVGAAGTGHGYQVALVLHLLGRKRGLGRREGRKRRVGFWWEGRT